jgi:hypothetical protein
MFRGIVLLLIVATPVAAGDAARDIAAAIDREIAADLARHGIPAAPQTTDLAFLRRASLDLLGRIPTLDEIRSFEADPSADKRAKRLDAMLASGEFAAHYANVTRVSWMPQSLGNFQLQFAGAEFEGWLETQIQKNKPFDETVKAILTAEANVGQRGMVDFGMRGGAGEKVALAAFYRVADGKPEEMAAMTSRLFLGLKLECAQCHDHPFAPYSRDQFWEFAAFFGEFTPLSPVRPTFVGPLPPQYESNRIAIPNTKREVSARIFFDQSEPDWQPGRTPRRELADWLTKPGNRWFARTMANRTWAYLLGIGLTDPIDEPGDANPPSHPALLDRLTDAVIANRYDLKTMLKGIALSRPYQSDSRATHPGQGDLRRFARFATRGLSGHQVYDSLTVASGKSTGEESKQAKRIAASEAQGGVRGEFVSRFPQSNRPTESATSILQSLMLMNGTFVSKWSSRNPVLEALAKADRTDQDKLDELFLRTLTRRPTDDERDAFGSFLADGGPLGDVAWVLVNSGEFLLNH